MRLSAPKRSTFLVALVVGAAGIVLGFVDLGPLLLDPFWLVALAFVLLALGSLMDAL